LAAGLGRAGAEDWPGSLGPVGSGVVEVQALSARRLARRRKGVRGIASP
jgi:hypothetical protein